MVNQRTSKRVLATAIATLSTHQQQEVLTIVQRHGIPLTQNQNGFFFNMDDVTPDCLVDIQKFVSYSQENQKLLDDYDRQLQMCKIARVKSPVKSVRSETDDVQVEQKQVSDPPVCTDTATRSVSRFMLIKKRLGRPLRHKAFDPDDVSCLAVP